MDSWSEDALRLTSISWEAQPPLSSDHCDAAGVGITPSVWEQGHMASLLPEGGIAKASLVLSFVQSPGVSQDF